LGDSTLLLDAFANCLSELTAQALAAKIACPHLWGGRENSEVSILSEAALFNNLLG
jgi:hypothetical protein